MTVMDQARALFFEGLAHHERHRFAAAEARYREALALMPDRVSVLVNLSAVLIAQSKFDEAAALCRRVLVIEPDNTDCRAHLDACRHAGGTTRQRWLQLEQAVVAHPDDAGAHDRLGNAWLDNDEPRRALDCFETALRLAPGDISASIHRAQALRALGRPDDALRAYLDCLAGSPGSLLVAQAALILLVERGHTMAWALHDPRVVRLLIEGLGTPLLPPQSLAPLAMAKVALDLPRADAPAAALEVLADMPLLMRVLVHARITAPALERLLTDTRRRLLAQLTAVDSVAALEPVVRLAVAIATQCWRNEYCWAQTEAETEQVHALAARLQGGHESPFEVLAFAMYAPVDSVLSDHAGLRSSAWPDAITRLVTQQLALRQQARAASVEVPSLTGGEHTASGTASDDEDSEPLPRWTAVPAQSARIPLPHFARQVIAGAPVIELASAPGGIRALHAACGTGQHAIEMALRIDGLHLLAVDTSRACLGYAMALARRHAAAGIAFAQAGPAQLHASGRRFDFIDASRAFLQQQGTSDAAIAALVACLAPRGLLRLAFDTRRGRRGIQPCRDWVRTLGATPIPDGIRALREAVLALPDDDPRREPVRFDAFYATSECRDLLLPAAEATPCDLIEIPALLARHGVRPLGLEVPQTVQQAFTRRMPGARLDDFAAWDRFEDAHPRTFERTLIVWAQMPG